MTFPAHFNTPIRMIQYAMEDAGLLQEGDEPNSEQIAKYSNRLNDMINLWQTQGLKLWLLVDQPIILQAGKRDYSMIPGGDVDITKPTQILQGYYLDTGNNQRPLYPLSWDEWLRLSNRVQQGAITQYFVDTRFDQVSVSLWLTPDATAATGTVHLLLRNQILSFTGITDTMTFPQEWFLALRWGLADEICTGQPQSIMDRCAGRSAVYRQMLEDFDVEEAPTRFQPDSRSGGSAFR